VRKILVTTALPYANAPLHLGHILEHVQADIWVRWQKMFGNDCIFVGGEDAHGTAIMLSAEKEGITPETWIANMKTDHEKDLAGFHVVYDNYHTTHSAENLALTTEIYEQLKINHSISTSVVEQAYDPVKEMFLPDRFIRGTCPRCKAPDQYGDGCEVCGATYTAAELLDAVSQISGSKPITKSSEHYFFLLEKYAEMLQTWSESDAHVQPEIANKLKEWFKVGLKSWDISRDAPYFGFAIPGATNKYFYVWMDAPIGYIASFKNLCTKRQDLDFDSYWKSESATELYHFVGKDIIYFHALFWPAVLYAAGWRRPTAIFTHGFLNINGQKMSKSRGTFVTASSYLEHLDPEYFRYYLAAKLNASIDDLDLNFTDFVQRVNSDLVGKFVNIASRCASFINKHFAGKMATTLAEPALFEKFVASGERINELYTSRQYSEAMREIMSLADLANQYIDQKKPWTLAKDQQQLPEVQAITSMGLNLFRLLLLYLKPVLPRVAKEAEKFLNIPELTWQDLKKPLLGHTVLAFTPLLQRVDAEKIKLIVNI
jgi:methionyl-tRNA synthetase